MTIHRAQSSAVGSCLGFAPRLRDPPSASSWRSPGASLTLPQLGALHEEHGLCSAAKQGQAQELDAAVAASPFSRFAAAEATQLWQTGPKPEGTMSTGSSHVSRSVSLPAALPLHRQRRASSRRAPASSRPAASPQPALPPLRLLSSVQQKATSPTVPTGTAVVSFAPSPTAAAAAKAPVSSPLTASPTKDAKQPTHMANIASMLRMASSTPPAASPRPPVGSRLRRVRRVLCGLDTLAQL